MDLDYHASDFLSSVNHSRQKDKIVSYQSEHFHRLSIRGAGGALML